ncbi:MAG: hypothetical protein ACI8R4_004263 [Paracoccaceae bacterium]|jgi:hypothetical protein
MIRIIALLTGMALLAACTQSSVNEPPEELGAFKMRVNYTFAEKAVKGPVSRAATSQEWEAALKDAMASRLGKYDGPQEYDVAVTLEGYMLAPGGIPIVYSPKSTAIVNLFVYDVAQKKYLVKKHQLQVLEDTTQESLLVGSGHSRTKEEQMAGLALKVALEVEDYMSQEHVENGWFNPITPTVIDPEAPAIPASE